MFCTKCGNQLNDRTSFCPKCGTPIEPPPAPANTQPVEQPKPVTPQQKPVVNPQVAPVKKKKNNSKNLLIILALLLVFVLLIGSAIPVVIFAVKNISETKAEGVTYHEDFPVLKNQTELYVYDEVNFPVGAYEIKVEKYIIGGAIKAICARSKVIVDTTSEPVYNLDLADGDYRITLTAASSTNIESLDEHVSEYENMVDDYLSDYENVVDNYASGYKDIVDDYVSGYEDALDDYYTIGEETTPVVIIDVKVDGENESAIDAVNLSGEPIVSPDKDTSENNDKDTSENNDEDTSENNDEVTTADNNENADDADKFIEATYADWESFNSSLPILYYYDYSRDTFEIVSFIECELTTTFGDVGALYLLYFEDYSNDDWWEVQQKYHCSESDPKRKFTGNDEYDGYIRLPKKNVKWLCEEVFNVEFDENYVSEESYVHGDYVYRGIPAGGIGDASEGWDEYDIVSSPVVDGKYEIVIEHYFCYDEGENVVRDLLSTKQMIAKIKVKDDGERFWSYYEIKEYDPN